MVNQNTPIMQILREHPHVRKIFSKHGMACIGCLGSSTESLENGAKLHDLDVEELLAEINQAIQEKE